MKKVYNKFTTSDIPLDASLDAPQGPTSKIKSTTSKPTIKAIGSKAKSSSTTKATTKKPTTKSTNKTTANQPGTEIKKGSVRKKLVKDSVDLENLEKINEENIKSHSFRAKRNQGIVILLSILLAIAIAIIVVYAVLSKVESNCFLYTNGDAEATYIVNGEELSEFRSPANIRGDCVFTVNIDLKIHTPGDFNVKFLIKCYNGDKLLTNVVIYEPNTADEGFTYKSDGYYHSKSVIKGNTTTRLCKGVALNELGINLSDDEFKMEVYTIIKKV